MCLGSRSPAGEPTVTRAHSTEGTRTAGPELRAGWLLSQPTGHAHATPAGVGSHPPCLQPQKSETGCGWRSTGLGAAGAPGKTKKIEKSPTDWPVLPLPWGAKEQPGAGGESKLHLRRHSPRASRGQEGGGTKGLSPERRWPAAPTPRRPQECPLRTAWGCWKTGDSGLSCHQSPPSLQPRPVLKHCIWQHAS